MKLKRESWVSSLALLSVVACGSDVLKFSDDSGSGGGNGMGGDSMSGDGDGDTGGTSSGGMGTGSDGSGSSTSDGGTGTGGGTGGHIDPGPDLGGFGGMGGGGSVVPTWSLELRSKIKALQGTDDGVYWIEYGTFDALDNYQRDGRVMFLENGSDEPVEVVGGLHGPVRLGVTDDEIYLVVDASILNSLDDRTELWRFDRGTQQVQYVRDGSGDFVTLGSDALFVRGSSGNIFALDDANEPQLLFDEYFQPDSVVMDEEKVFMLRGNETVAFVDRTSGEYTQFEDKPGNVVDLALYGQSVFLLSATYLIEGDQDGNGLWQNVVEFDQGVRAWPRKLEVYGDRYVVLIENDRGGWWFGHGWMDQLEAGYEAIEVPTDRFSIEWGMNEENIFWFVAPSRTLHRIPIPD